MHVISFKKLREFFEKDPNSRVALQDWYKRVSKADWDDFSDVKKTFNSVGNYLMWNGIIILSLPE